MNVRKAGIFLRDDDTDDQNPRVIPSLLDINKGNRQVAHGITEVLRPSNLFPRADLCARTRESAQDRPDSPSRHDDDVQVPRAVDALDPVELDVAGGATGR